MLTESFDFVLPQKLIAHEPAAPRDACRLMVLNRHTQSIYHQSFFDLVTILQPGDVLVFNRSKVIPARLILPYKQRFVEVLLTKRLNDTDWLSLVRPGKLFFVGKSMEVGDGLEFTVQEVRADGQRVLRFSDDGEVQERVLKKVGRPPYPPYIKETKATFDDYQTVFAQEEGSVAAPTAGLHFTRHLLGQLASVGVQQEFVTLHVGLGTFLPIKSRRIEDHFMHDEGYIMDHATAGRLSSAKRECRRIIAVGTTSVRVLEDSYNSATEEFEWGERNTDMYIYPGYKWKVVDGLITNFHLPKSSLLLLTCAFGGTDFVLRSYQEAVRRNYRFYSFGDAMFIL